MVIEISETETTPKGNKMQGKKVNEIFHCRHLYSFFSENEIKTKHENGKRRMNDEKKE